MLDQAFDIAQITALGRIAERKGVTGRAGPGRTSDTVDVAFRLVGQFEVDDVGYAVHIDTAGGNIRCYQNSGIAVAETFERPLPCAL